jgi:DNA primase
VVIVEGCFDAAKLVEAGTRNVVATFGARLYEDQLPRLKLIADRLGVRRFLVWFDRDRAGIEGQSAALSLLAETGFEGVGFDWGVRFASITDKKDTCDFSVEELKELISSHEQPSFR